LAAAMVDGRYEAFLRRRSELAMAADTIFHLHLFSDYLSAMSRVPGIGLMLLSGRPSVSLSQ
jgi:hypothetical protein